MESKAVFFRCSIVAVTHHVGQRTQRGSLEGVVIDAAFFCNEAAWTGRIFSKDLQLEVEENWF